MLTKLDLAALAEDIDTAYRPRPLAALERAGGALCICEGPRSWHREAKQNELWLVLDGVITLETPSRRLVVSDGELATIPQHTLHTAHSGMRSPVLIFSEMPMDSPGTTNGHPPPPFQQGEMLKRNVGSAVHIGASFEWIEMGVCGKYAAHATRLTGTSLPYHSGVPLLLVVYRGVLDYTAADETGSVVGSQALHVPSDTTITLHAERGASVVVFHLRGAPLPEQAAAVTGAAEG